MPSGVRFTNEILPILKSRCTNYHRDQKTEEGLNLTSYDLQMAGSENGPVVIPGDAANILLVKSIMEWDMPKRGPKLSSEQLQLIMDRGNAGAQEN